MGKLNTGRVALAFGTFMATVHIMWDILWACGWSDPFLRIFVSLHGVEPSFIFVRPFEFGTAAELVIFAFLLAYLLGWIFASCWNMVKK